MKLPISNRQKFVLFSAIVNAFIVYIIGFLSYRIISSYDYIYYISGAELEGNLFLINLLCTSLVFPFLIRINKNYTKHIWVLLLYELLLIVLHQVYFIGFLWRFPESITDFDWWHSFLYEIKYVTPQVILISIGFYFNQLILGKKLLPKLYNRL